jgi:hypothetical protein
VKNSRSGQKLSLLGEWRRDNESSKRKLLRFIVGDELSEKAPGIAFDRKDIAKMRIVPVSRRRLVMSFEQADDAEQQWKRVVNE